MARLKIKGYQNFIEISDKKAIEVKRMWLDDKVSKFAKIDVEEWAGEKREIAALIIGREDVAAKEREEEFAVDAEKRREEFMRHQKLSPQSKAEMNKAFLSIWWFAITGNKSLAAQEWETYHPEVVRFFELNPLRTRFDIRFVKHMLPGVREASKSGAMLHVANPMRVAAGRIVTSSIEVDCKAAGTFDVVGLKEAVETPQAAGNAVSLAVGALGGVTVRGVAQMLHLAHPGASQEAEKVAEVAETRDPLEFTMCLACGGDPSHCGCDVDKMLRDIPF